MALISVIIPCYNVYEFIDRCMDSVVNQTIGIENLEIILVNDASTDNTLEKLSEWETNYPDNICVITYEENLRQGGARNIGMQYATSDYIGFVDADDYLELDAYEKLYDQVKDKSYDKVSAKFIREDYPGQEGMNPDKAESGSVCTAIYKRSVIIDNNIWFPERIAYEDNYWGAILKLYVKEESVINDIIYHYISNTNSTVTQRNAIHQLDRLDVEIGIIEEYKARGVFEQYKDELEAQFVQRFYLNSIFIIFTRFDYIPDVMEDMRKKVWEYFPEFMDNPYFERCHAREKVLLKLLGIQREIMVDEWESLKRSYLATLGWI